MNNRSTMTVADLTVSTDKENGKDRTDRTYTRRPLQEVRRFAKAVKVIRDLANDSAKRMREARSAEAQKQHGLQIAKLTTAMAYRYASWKVFNTLIKAA